jgi:glycerol uptake facilitator-like aquaporin
VIMAMIYAVGHISGAHFNAAVTFAFALSRHFPWPRAIGYWCAQFLGALIAAALLRGSLGNVAHVGATLPSGSQGQSFLWELVLSFFLMFVIMAVATTPEPSAKQPRSRSAARSDSTRCSAAR